MQEELNKKEMRVMLFPLKILTAVGCWPPVSWSLLKKRIVYNAYTLCLSTLLLSQVVPQILDIILNVNSADEFTETFYVMLALFNGTAKMFSLLMNRKNIEMLTNALTEKPFRPLELDEIEIQQKFDNIVKRGAWGYLITVQIVVACQNLTSLLTNFRKGILAYREWVPYDYSSNIMYYVIFFRQLTALTTTSMVNIACDWLICGLLLHIYCQFEILEYRLKKCLRNQINIGECVRHHDHIYKFAYLINKKFRIIIGVQFSVSMLVMCSSMFQLATMPFGAESFSLIVYVLSMSGQIFFYCYCGNEIKLKSTQLFEEVFKMDWVKADKQMKENLIMIMNRSLTPIEFSSIHIVTVNLDSFVKLLKTSYSAYSVLQHA